MATCNTLFLLAIGEFVGEYRKYSGKLDYAVAVQDAQMTLEVMDLLLTHTGTLMDFVKSPLYEHMTFAEPNTAMMESVKANQLKMYLEDETFEFVRESEGGKISRRNGINPVIGITTFFSQSRLHFGRKNNIIGSRNQFSQQ